MTLKFALPDNKSLPLYLISREAMEAQVGVLQDRDRAWAESVGFQAGAGEICLLPCDEGLGGVLVGLGGLKDRKRERFILGGARARLPEVTFHLKTTLASTDLDEQLVGWLLSGYSFNRYNNNNKSYAQLIAPDGVDAERLEAIVAAEAFTRDLINTPASDMGPDDLHQSAEAVAHEYGADFKVTVGDALLAENFPMVHAVGRAASRAPRLIEMNWGSAGPKLTLVGKGVCFDTGGLNLKPGSSMGLMKKDMGGAATVLGLAKMIMALNVPLQLRVLIPAVENSVSADAFRPQDILTSRKGLTVEVNNTDAEGRLVLADALALADEDPADLTISMATLTGAARVAVGPDLAPFYATDPRDASYITQSAQKVADPVWEMPFWDPYERMIEPGIADLDNAPAGGFAGSITAALFLRRFVTRSERYMHFDIYGWNPTPAPARPKGGVGQGARAILEALPDLLGL